MGFIGDVGGAVGGAAGDLWNDTGGRVVSAGEDIWNTVSKVSEFVDDPKGFIKKELVGIVEDAVRTAAASGLEQALNVVKEHSGLGPLIEQVESIADVIQEYGELLMKFAMCADYFNIPAFHTLTGLLYAARVKGWVHSEEQCRNFGQSGEVMAVVRSYLPNTELEDILNCAVDIAFTLPLPTAVDGHGAPGGRATRRPQTVRCAVVWEPSTEGEGQAYGADYAQMSARYAQEWGNNWRLKLMNAYVFEGKLFYGAAWKPSSGGQRVLWGKPYNEYRAFYDEIWPQGWRLEQLSPYIWNDQLHFSAVWNPGTHGEIQDYQLTVDGLTQRAGERLQQGMRLELFSAFVHRDQVYYSAVWRPGNDEQLVNTQIEQARFNEVYGEMWDRGWRVKTISPYVLHGQVFYAVRWKRGRHGQIVAWDWSYSDVTVRYNQLWSQGWRLTALSPFVR